MKLKIRAPRGDSSIDFSRVVSIINKTVLTSSSAGTPRDTALLVPYQSGIILLLTTLSSIGSYSLPLFTLLPRHASREFLSSVVVSCYDRKLAVSYHWRGTHFCCTTALLTMSQEFALKTLNDTIRDAASAI